MSTWSEAADANQQADDWANGWRDEIASQRATDAHRIVDNTPTRNECAEDDQ